MTVCSTERDIVMLRDVLHKFGRYTLCNKNWQSVTAVYKHLVSETFRRCWLEIIKVPKTSYVYSSLTNKCTIY
jgi:hypothetical protein